MARKDAHVIFALADGVIRAGWGARSVSLPAVEQDGEDGEPVLVVELDAIEAWDDGSDIALKDLQRLLELVERECDALGVEVEFE